MTLASAEEQPSAVYETDRSLGEYLLFHYGRPDEQFPWPDGPKEALDFPTRSVVELMDDRTPVRSALDLGCAVGKSSFVLSGLADKVVGIDYSASFVRAAQAMQETGELAFRFHEEGSRWREGVAKVDKPAQNVSFEQGDACDLRRDLGSFNLVHAANLLCRLTDPMRLLNRLVDLVAPGGQLLLTTPFTWLEEFTPQENWLEEGGSESALKKILQHNFELEFEKNLPFLIREHRRKYQYTMALGMRWRRRVSQ